MNFLQSGTMAMIQSPQWNNPISGSYKYIYIITFGVGFFFLFFFFVLCISWRSEMKCDSRIVEQQNKIPVWPDLVKSLYFNIW